MTTSAAPDDVGPEPAPGPPDARPRLNTAELLYGTVVAAAVLAVSTQADDTAGSVVISVLATLAIYWFIHVYTRVLSERAVRPAATRWSVARHAFVHESAVLLGGLPVLAVFVVASLLGAEVLDATTVALWATVILLGAVGYGAARQAGARGWVLAAEASAAALFGVVVVILKASLE